MKQDTTLDSVLKPIALFIIGTPLVAAYLAAAYIWTGYVLSIMWAWFVTPTFGVPVLSVPIAIGVTMVAGMLTKQHVPSDKDESKWMMPVRNFIGPALTLLIGWIVTRFI